MKKNIGFVMLFSIGVKGIGAVIEIIIQWIITKKIGIDGYGDYTFYINCGDIAFWCLFSGIVKVNTFYLSDGRCTLKKFKKKYLLYYMLPVVIISFILVTISHNALLYIAIAVFVLQFVVNDNSSTYMANGEYGIALSGEYVVGRLFLLIGYIILLNLTEISISKLLILYCIQYLVVIAYFFIFRKRVPDCAHYEHAVTPIFRHLRCPF